MLRQIVNPETGKIISTESQMGKRLLKKLIKQTGGKESDWDTCFPNADNVPEVGSTFCVRAIHAGPLPNFDNKRHSLDDISDWNMENLTIHHYVEVVTDYGCIFTYMLGATKDDENGVFTSPDYTTRICRKRAEECLEKQSQKKRYTYQEDIKKGKRTLDIEPTDRDGCNRVCIGIQHILPKDIKDGNNNLPRGFVVPKTDGRLTKAQVKILEHIHRHAIDNGAPGSWHDISINSPFKYDLYCSVPGARALQAANEGVKGIYDYFSSKSFEAFKQFANCQTFARDFAFYPVSLYSKLYPGEIPEEIAKDITPHEWAVNLFGK
jgi:hypothetical protein